MVGILGFLAVAFLATFCMLCCIWVNSEPHC